MSELARHLGTSLSSLQRELDSLSASGILERKQDGRRAYYKAPRDSSVFPALRDLFLKTAGIVPALQSELARFRGKIRWAAIDGSIARGEEAAQSDIDLLVVNDIATADLLPVLRRVERRGGREVNVKRYSQERFRDWMPAGDHFLKSVVRSKAISLIRAQDGREAASCKS